jgi:hypothetical protein
MRTDSSPSTRIISNGLGEAAHQGLSHRRNEAAAPCPADALALETDHAV